MEVGRASESHRAAVPFDGLAAGYDASFTDTRLGRWLRSAVWRHADRLFVPPGTILDIGCGTGEDACYLARRGHRVVATDASSDMLTIAQHKAERAGCANRIEFRRLPIEDLAGAFTARSFAGVLSNFGALNCAADIGRAGADLAKLLQPGAPLLLVMLGRHTFWEWGWFLARLDARSAFRRLRRGGVEWRQTRIRYPGRRELRRMLAPHFDELRERPLGIVLPPTYAAGWLNRRPRLFRSAAAAERAVGRFGVVTGADHVIVEGRCR